MEDKGRHVYKYTHAPTFTPKMLTIATIEENSHRLDKLFDAAYELYRKHEYEQCAEALRDLLADPAISMWPQIRCLTLLGGALSDWKEAYECYVEAYTIWSIMKRRYGGVKDPRVHISLKNLHGGLNNLKQLLMDEEEGLVDSMQDSDAEAKMLHALATYEGSVEEVHAIADAEGEACGDIEMADDGDHDHQMGDDDTMGDDDSDDEDETSDAEGGKKPKVEEQTKEANNRE